MRSFLVGCIVLSCASAASAQSALVPQPQRLAPASCRAAFVMSRPLRFPASIDDGGFALLRERWAALGIPAPTRVAAGSDVAVAHRGDVRAGAYTLVTDGAHVAIASGDAGGEGAFDALATLAQLPAREGGRWTLPCVTIADAPAMRWRILSDDVSRGPFPTMEYAKKRIRTLASLKINGWSPYMEQVVVDPRAPFIAWPNGWTTAQLHELALYARRYHVTLIPEQQTFAHMHETLKWEAEAPLAELPHGWLLAESDPRTYAYLEPLVRGVAAAAMPVPFVHLGADEPIDLGRGRTPRTAAVFGAHVTRVAGFLPAGVRPIIWDDAIQQDPSILSLIPKDTVVATFHYGVEQTYRPYVDRIANAGFDQLLSPGAANWNEIYPDLGTAYANVGRFIRDGKGARGVLGMFMTVWHDDGESLYEATWPAVAYAAASAWQAAPVDDATWNRTFARAFFGSDDARYGDDLNALQALRPLLRTSPSDPPDYLFWHDPFDARLQARSRTMDLSQIRTIAERVLTDLWSAQPPLNADAVAAMRLGALRYDQLGRRLQIGAEAKADYDDARAHAVKPGVTQVYRSLNLAKYLCWELRDGLAAIAPQYAAAWRTESTEPGLDRILVKYAAAEADAQRCADRIDAATREDYLRSGTLPSWDALFAPVSG
ncbi:MAG TPA: glycoside hydrolase family 20 zincin-like fold domain-containing protein [Candidatus Elarobacter sp.]